MGFRYVPFTPLETFSEFQFHTKIYPPFFRSDIFSVDDTRNKSAHDLYDICEQDYCLTMKTYYVLKKTVLLLAIGMSNICLRFYLIEMLLCYGKNVESAQFHNLQIAVNSISK
jgi:hypothetical protein